ncbi:SlyX family protein [Pararhodobacter sp.]
MTDRIAQLEEQIAHLQRMVDELSDIVRIQGETLDRMARRVGALIEREAEREADGGAQIPLADQRPPHW